MDSERLSLLPRLAAVGLISGLAACSSDTMRFAGSPFSNPFQSARSEPMLTGSVAPATAPVAAAPTAPVTAQPLPPIPSNPAPTGIVTAPAAVNVAPPTVTAARPTQPGWSAYGGTPVVIGQGDTLARIADRYGVPSSAILSANGLTNASQVTAGTSIVIPVFNAASPQTAQASAPAPAKAQPSIQRQAAQAPVAAPPRAPTRNATPQAPARVAEKPQAEPPRPQRVASVAPMAVPAAAPPARQAAPAPAAAPAAAPAPAPRAAPAAKEPVQTASLPADVANGLDFRWPVRGRVIAGFGAGGNEGINIAVPEGTPVKAAESGTVAYAGSELKGYGKLILVRHENGYVSAYAHNDELLVSRGEKVRRGQVIAKSGRSGNVNAPQLHFEIRKGSSPVNPMPYLGG